MQIGGGGARVSAETFVAAYDPLVPPVEMIARASADAAFAFIGLRAPVADEPPSTYADYFRKMRDATASLPCAVFALAAEGVRFRRIFKE